MKPIFNKSGLDNLLELIKNSNVGVDITSAQVTISDLADIPASERTKVTVIAVQDAGYSGQVDVDYIRHKLTDYAQDGDYIFIEGSNTLASAKLLIAEQLGVVEESITWGFDTLPDAEGTQVVIVTMEVNPDVVYKDTESVDVILSTVDLTEDVRGHLNQIRITSNGRVRGITHLDPEPPIG